MTEDPATYCLNPSHIYAEQMPPCETLGVKRISELERALKELTEAVISFASTKGVKKGHDAWMRLFNAYNAGCEALKPRTAQ